MQHLWRRNPLKSKILTKRLDKLTAIGLPYERRVELERDLSGNQVNAANAIYVLDWWGARLSLELHLASMDGVDPKAEQQAIRSLQIYCNKYHISPYDIALDGELSIDKYIDLQHYIQMSDVNPYFREAWPLLHRVWFTRKRRWWADDEPKDYSWLGYWKHNCEIPENTDPISYCLKHDETVIDKSDDKVGPMGTPAIKLLRGNYWNDPRDVKPSTKYIGKQYDIDDKEYNAIHRIEATKRPSDICEFLHAAEQLSDETTFFIPKRHEPFLEFDDGCAWTIVRAVDTKAEKKSLADCATAENSTTAVIISLRQPISESPKGTYYRTLLRAEVILPKGIPGVIQFKDFNNCVINQLRGRANSKPIRKYHKYIIPLLIDPIWIDPETPDYEVARSYAPNWLRQLVRPSYRPNDIFWPTDLSESDLHRVREANPDLFNAKEFYEEIKNENLKYPDRIEDQIIEGIDFPTEQVVAMIEQLQALEDVADRAKQLTSSREGKVIRGSLRRRLKGMVEDPQLKSLLGAVNNLVASSKNLTIIEQMSYAGYTMELETAVELLIADFTGAIPTPRYAYQRVRNKCVDAIGHHVGRWAAGNNVPGIEEALAQVRQLMMDYPGDQDLLLKTKVKPTASQVLGLLKTLLFESPQQRFKLYKLVIKCLTDWNTRHFENTDPDLEAEIGLHLREMLAASSTPYDITLQILATGVGKDRLPYARLSTKQIVDILSEKKLLPGPAVAALYSVDAWLKSGRETKPSNRTLQNLARKALFRSKAKDIVTEGLKYIVIPTSALVRTLRNPRITTHTRHLILEILTLRLRDANSTIRTDILGGVRRALISTKNKSFIRAIFRHYDGHQSQYHLFKAFVDAQGEWLALERNQKFFVSLLLASMPNTTDGHYSQKGVSKKHYSMFKRLIEKTDHGFECVFKLLFEISIDQESKPLVGKLIQVLLKRIIDNPSILTSEICDWYQEAPAGWGSTERRHFSPGVPLTRTLYRQFNKMIDLTQATGNGCYLDFMSTIAYRLSDEDKVKLLPIINRVAKMQFTSTSVQYAEDLKRLLGVRRKRMLRRRNR